MPGTSVKQGMSLGEQLREGVVNDGCIMDDFEMVIFTRTHASINFFRLGRDLELQA